MTIEQDAPDSAFTPEFEAADDARYAEFAEKHGSGTDDTSRDESNPSQQAEAPDDEGNPTPKPPERAPLTQAQLEERLNQTKAAMREERRKRREIENQLEEVRRAAPQVEDPFEAVIAALREDDEDPLADLANIKEVLRRFQASQRAEREAELSQRTHQTAAQRHFAHVAEQEAEFREETPDYDDAVTHFRTSLRAELEDQGFSGAALDQEFGRNLISLSQKAIAAGKNPAEVVYALAKRRGYTPNASPSNPDLDKSKEKLQTLSRSQAAGRSLSAVGGRSGDGELTLASVAKLDGKELLEGYAKLKAQAKKTGRYR